MVPMTLTGTPLSFVGVNLQLLAALTAASFNNGWPEIGRAEITLPSSSTVTSTTTAPLTRAAFARGGYVGGVLLVASP